MVKLFVEAGEKLVEVRPEVIDDKRERELERLILTQPQILGEELLFIGEQASFPEIGGDAIDILALDPEANTVIIELKKGTAPSSSDFQLLKYAGYVHTLGPDDLARKAREFLLQPQNAEYRKSLETELELEEGWTKEIDLVDLVVRKFESHKYEVYEAKFNKKQRIVLLAEAFDQRIGSVLVWLHRQGVDVRGYVYSRFKAGESTFYAVDQVIPSPDIEAELAERTRKHMDRPWQRDGEAWHQDPEQNWEENIELVKALSASLSKYPGVEAIWNQKLYVKFFGPVRRELRVFTAQKKGRLDLVFMHETSPQRIEELLRRHGAKVKVYPSHVYEDSPWIGLESAGDLEGGVDAALGVWLSEAPPKESRP